MGRGFGGAAGVAAAMIAMGAAAMAARAAEGLVWPIACGEGVDCFVQQYVDVDSGPGVRDPFCGPRAYDGHDGVDIRLRHAGEIARDVAVLAAAAGVVAGARDGEPDRLYDGRDLGGRDCGNGVVLDHGDGRVTQYCHLKRGSVAVGRGDRVAAGARLGAVGLSGRTEFPHLHFELREGGEPVDPYLGLRVGQTCSAPDTATLATRWAEPRAYAPAAILDLGLAAELPDYGALKQGAYREPVARTAPALLAWVEAIGLRKGDVLAIRLLGPDGAALAESATDLDRDRAAQFAFAGRRLRAAAWPAGAYTVEARLTRAGATIAAETRRMALE